MQLFGARLRHPLWGVLLPIPLFVLGHGYNPAGQVDVAFFALAAGLLVWRTGGLEAAIVLHAVNNTAASLLAAVGLSDPNATHVGWGPACSSTIRRASLSREGASSPAWGAGPDVEGRQQVVGPIAVEVRVRAAERAGQARQALIPSVPHALGGQVDQPWAAAEASHRHAHDGRGAGDVRFATGEHRNRVVLPAPLRPSNPTMAPSGTDAVTSCRACTDPNRTPSRDVVRASVMAGLLNQCNDIVVGEPEAAGLGEGGSEELGGEVGAAASNQGVAGPRRDEHADTAPLDQDAVSDELIDTLERGRRVDPVEGGDLVGGRCLGPLVEEAVDDVVLDRLGDPDEQRQLHGPIGLADGFISGVTNHGTMMLPRRRRRKSLAPGRRDGVRDQDCRRDGAE